MREFSRHALSQREFVNQELLCTHLTDHDECREVKTVRADDQFVEKVHGDGADEVEAGRVEGAGSGGDVESRRQSHRLHPPLNGEQEMYCRRGVVHVAKR